MPGLSSTRRPPQPDSWPRRGLNGGANAIKQGAEATDQARAVLIEMLDRRGTTVPRPQV